MFASAHYEPHKPGSHIISLRYILKWHLTYILPSKRVLLFRLSC